MDCRDAAHCGSGELLEVSTSSMSSETETEKSLRATLICFWTVEEQINSKHGNR